MLLDAIELTDSLLKLAKLFGTISGLLLFCCVTFVIVDATDEITDGRRLELIVSTLNCLDLLFVGSLIEECVK